MLSPPLVPKLHRGLRLARRPLLIRRLLMLNPPLVPRLHRDLRLGPRALLVRRKKHLEVNNRVVSKELDCDASGQGAQDKKVD